MSREYSINNSQYKIQFGDITSSDADVIVSSDDYYLTMTAGVAAAILAKGGETVKNDTKKHIPAETGNVVITTAGNLPNKYIFHGITIGEKSLPFIEIVYEIIQNSISILDSLKLSSIAFPVVGTGTAGFKFSEVAIIMSELITHNLHKRNKPIAVSLYLYDKGDSQFDPGTGKKKDFNIFFDEMERLQGTIELNPLQKSISLIDDIDDINFNRSFPDLIKIQKLILRSKFAFWENNIEAQSRYLSEALDLLEDSNIEGPTDQIRETIINEMTIIKAKISAGQPKSDLLTQMKKNEYTQYVDNALKIINDLKISN
ncbi:MAG: macro domain-containing protein [Candidatus Kariarchaeaceae archaeon]